uniref:Uncharacterized protein n=1 Tax=Anopheles merus TaxID=30066 RepID=A0A182VFW9_ANOME
MLCSCTTYRLPVRYHPGWPGDIAISSRKSSVSSRQLLRICRPCCIAAGCSPADEASDEDDSDEWSVMQEVQPLPASSLRHLPFSTCTCTVVGLAIDGRHVYLPESVLRARWISR